MLNNLPEPIWAVVELSVAMTYSGFPSTAFARTLDCEALQVTYGVPLMKLGAGVGKCCE